MKDIVIPLHKKKSKYYLCFCFSTNKYEAKL